jgi:hypothetical protein
MPVVYVGVAGRCSRTYRLLTAALAGWPARATSSARHRGGGMDQTARPRAVVAEKTRGQGSAPTGEGRSRPTDEWAALPTGRVVASVDG